MIDFGIERIVGPVFVVRGTAAPVLTYKALFKDGSQMVLSVVMRVLWAGADGIAWSHQADHGKWAEWKNMGVMRPSGVIQL